MLRHRLGALCAALPLLLVGCSDHGVKAATSVYSAFIESCSGAHTPKELVDAGAPFLAAPEAEAWKTGLSKMPSGDQTRPFQHPYVFSRIVVSGSANGTNVALQTMEGEGVRIDLANEGGAWKVVDPLFDWTGQASEKTWKQFPALAASLTISAGNLKTMKEHLKADPGLAKIKLDPLECTLIYEAVNPDYELPESERLAMVQMLLDQGVPVDTPDQFGETALEEGIDFLKVERLLIAKGADVNRAEQSGRTPLYFACEADDQVHDRPFEVVSLLVEHGAKVNALDKDGDSPLLKAVDATLVPGNGDKMQARSLQLLTYLVAHGADVNVKDKNGKTALSLARESKLAASEKFLLAHGAK